MNLWKNLSEEAINYDILHQFLKSKSTKGLSLVNPEKQI